MNWKALVSVALFTLSTPAFADAKGEALVQNWLSKLSEIQPIAAETTTTYTYGKWVAICKARYAIPENNGYTSHSMSRHDNEMPPDLVNDPLQDNLNPLRNGGFAYGSDNTKYLGSEIVAGTRYDVVQVYEPLNLHISPPTHLFDASKRKKDGTLAIKWYFDSDGIVRRMTFSAEPHAPNNRAASNAVSGASDNAAMVKATTDVSEKLTVIMIVDSLRKARTLPSRAALSDPLYIIPAEHPAGVQGYAFSTDGKLLAIGGHDRLQVVRTDTGESSFALDDSGVAILVDFSFDGRFLAFSTPNSIRVITTDKGQLIKTLDTGKSFFESIRMSPDGKIVATTDSGPDVKLWNVQTGMLERTLKANDRSYEALFSPDGRRLVTAGYNSEFLIWDTQTWQIVQRLPSQVDSFRPCAFSPDSCKVATVSEDSTVLLWDAATGKLMNALKGAAGKIWFLTFDNDGKTLYAGDRDERNDPPRRVPGYVSWNVETGAITADYAAWQPSNGVIIGHSVISPDGRFAAFRDTSFQGTFIRVFALKSRK